MDETLMLSVYYYDKRPFISAAELFDYIFPYSKKNYTQWVRINITNQPQEFPILGVDYVTFEQAKIKNRNDGFKGGKKRKDLLVSTLFAIQLCYQAKTLPAREAKNFLHNFAH